ncbi:uncharacterized protein LOC106476862 [Limulus polyphemus]|uniref:Uncharacterized protein LOC106476862 n=1 Tax=Limulus polyphemus TaxID=6850 RepID=A0ABM1RY57_LIMPO|nr:uncharacterized protein LOC106476862 [Limulus polyphemus]XP_022236313.1 uncharacterized protein LOC106476862 [Limulus polyphemus]
MELHISNFLTQTMTFNMLNCITSLDKILSEELNSTDQSIEACLKEIEEVLEGLGSRHGNGRGKKTSDGKSKKETDSVKKDVQTKCQRSCLSKIVFYHIFGFHSVASAA